MKESAADKGRAVDRTAADRCGKAPSSRETAGKTLHRKAPERLKKDGEGESPYFFDGSILFFTQYNADCRRKSPMLISMSMQ